MTGARVPGPRWQQDLDLLLTSDHEWRTYAELSGIGTPLSALTSRFRCAQHRCS